MMRFIFFYLFLLSFLHSDYLNTRNNHCLINLEPNQNSSGWCYHDQNTGRDRCQRRLSMDDLIDGYEFINNRCFLKNNLRVTGLTENQWNVSMAVLGHVVGFTFFFLVNFLVVLISRK